ncbi:hypothetical protein [Catenulispora rubra]|uniref:hypothetical protein n=1 Tax=Catenulispora rubra TaxID=280293 RepID=UPI00189263F7|nr:hypothetical protein [Catenulispora rubra]
MTTNTNTAGGESAAIRHVRDGYLADIARRDQMIRHHTEAAAQLRADNATDARHAEVAAALIAQIDADTLTRAWAPVNEIDAAALVADHVLIAGMPRTGKAGAGRALLLAALHDAVTDITVTDGKAAASLVHDHHPGTDRCPACMLTGAGDLAALDGISTGTGADR